MKTATTAATIVLGAVAKTNNQGPIGGRRVLPSKGAASSGGIKPHVLVIRAPQSAVPQISGGLVASIVRIVHRCLLRFGAQTNCGHGSCSGTSA
jgi:hypothetical protein